MKKNIDNRIFLFLLYFFLLFPFFKPRSVFLYNSIINSCYYYLPFFCFFVIFCMSIKKNNFSKIIYYIILFLLILFISTLLNNGDVTSCIFTMLHIITLSLIVDYGIRYHSSSFLNAFEFLLTTLVIINLVSILMNPNGMYTDSSGYKDNWFLGYRNIHILFILPALLISYINSFYKYNKLTIKNYLLLLVSIISLVLVNSSTSLIGIAIITIFTVFSGFFNNIKLMNIKTYFLTYIVLFFGIVVFRVQNIFSYIIEDILHKNLTLTGRVYIWDYVIDFIKVKPFLGYGIEDKLVRLNKTNYLQSYHAHNQFLEIAYQTGIIGFICFIIILFKSFKELFKYRKENIAKIISLVIFIFLIMMLTEAYSYEYFFYLFVFCYDIKYVLEKKDN